MGLFGGNGKFDSVTELSVFPSIGSVVLRMEDKLVVFVPSYLLGKHGNQRAEIASKFLELKTATQLLTLLKAYIKPSSLTGSKVEIKEINIGQACGYDSLIEVSANVSVMLPKREIRKNPGINVLYVDKGTIPKTTLMNFVLVPFNPQYGDGVDKLFRQKYSTLGFEDFSQVYMVVTMYPGKFAPPMSDKAFWNLHALMQEMN